MTVVLLVLDGLPLDRVDARTMPTLHALHPIAATGVMCSATYPNHATFVTGVTPLEHGLTGNWVVRDGTFHQAQDLGPRTPTVFDVCSQHGLATAAVFGDHHLVGVTGASRADLCWPPLGVVPEGTHTDGSGYATDAAVLPHLLDAIAGEAQLVVAQLNGGDTAGHESGPESEEARQAYSDYDRALAQVLRAAGPEDVVCVVSDHAQVPGVRAPAVDLWASKPDGLLIVPEGDAALIVGDDDGTWLDAVPGVAGHAPYGPDRLVWTSPGHLVGHGDAYLPGVHGGPATLTQVAAVHGHDPLRARLREGISSTAWAQVLLGLVSPQMSRSSRLG